MIIMSDYLDPNNEELLKDFFAEAEQQVCVFADDELGVELHGFVQRRQVVEGLHGNVGFVGHAVYVDDDLRRLFFDEFSGQAADHGDS